MVFLRTRMRILCNSGLLLLLWACAAAAPAACPGDTDWNGVVDISDLVRFFHYYHDQDPIVRCLADMNQDGETNVADLSVIFEEYDTGRQSASYPCPGDTNWDDSIGIGDLVRFFHYYRSEDLIVRMAADVNQDGRTNVADMVTIYDLYFGGCRD